MIQSGKYLIANLFPPGPPPAPLALFLGFNLTNGQPTLVDPNTVTDLDALVWDVYTVGGTDSVFLYFRHVPPPNDPVQMMSYNTTSNTLSFAPVALGYVTADDYTFRLDPVNGNAVAINLGTSGTVLDANIVNGQVLPGCAMLPFGWNGGRNQQWRLVERGMFPQQ